MKKTVSILCAIAIMFSMTTLTAKAISETRAENVQNIQKLLTLAQVRMDELTASGLLAVENCKEITDFDGNKLVVFEYSPTGYAIFSPKTGTFLETAPESPSPYLNRSSNLYYGGPKHYYVFDNDTFLNTITAMRLTEGDILALEDYSKKLDDMLMSSKSTNTLNYLNGKSADCSSTRSVSGTYYVNNYSRIKNLSSCGYVGGNHCGYIAAAMLLYYFDSTGHRDVIPGTNSDYYYTENNKYVLTTKLTNELISIGVDLGLNPTTTSYAIHRVVKKYLSNKSISGNIDHTSLFTPFFTKFKISQIIDDSEPVIIFGSLYSQSHNSSIDHAVLAYGYKATISYDEESYGTTTYEFIAHFGYTTYPFVYLNGVFGSIYSLSC